ncbi:MAG TPA: NADH-quinone oxidoreductase subunit J [Bryobacteraceae bacterium]|jgi:NADH-quinone oxidoreductase subunit J|nr:NADH-quinone oxidoreductase subunit J [Bryobacteraceae bacterium]
MDAFFFLIFATIAVVCAINIIVQTHPISSALSLVGVMGSLAALYLMLGAEFIAAAQMIVYAGAIMVLFVFVIMVLNAGGERLTKRGAYVRLFGVPLMAMFLGLLAFVIQAALPRGEMVRFGGFTRGGPADVGRALFTQYLLPFEVVSVLILIAIIGAIVLARKEID